MFVLSNAAEWLKNVAFYVVVASSHQIYSLKNYRVTSTSAILKQRTIFTVDGMRIEKFFALRQFSTVFRAFEFFFWDEIYSNFWKK